jgi:DNA-binding NarL/FixJ family response regulator
MIDCADLESAATPGAIQAAPAAQSQELSITGHAHDNGALADGPEAGIRGHRIEVLNQSDRDVVRVFILVSVSLYRDGLAQCLADEKSIAVVGSAADVPTALVLMRDLRPEVVLVDLGARDGPLTARSIRHDIPQVRIVALAVSAVYADIISWAEAGVSGYVTRDATLGDLVAAIEQAALGEIACPPHVIASLLGGLAVGNNACGPSHPEHLLTAREREIAQLLQQGMSNKQIASALTISLPTVKNHVHNVLRKLRVQRRADAVHQLQRVRSPLA